MKIKKIKKSNNIGFTLLEVMIAIFFLTVGIGGAFTVIQRTVGLSYINASRLVAANLAQEGIEIVRNIRDTNWIEGEDWDKGIGIQYTGTPLDSVYYEVQYNDKEADIVVCVTPCDYNDMRFLNIDEDSFYSYKDSGIYTTTKFKRKIAISDKDSDKLKVTVIVEWQERGTTHNFTAQEYLYNWK